MTDLKELRRLAAAATPGECQRNDSAEYAEITRANVMQAMVATDADASFLMAVANPQAVTALLDELELLKRTYNQLFEACANEQSRAEKAEAERDQLAMQVGALIGWVGGLNHHLADLPDETSRNLIPAGQELIRKAAKALTTPQAAALTEGRS